MKIAVAGATGTVGRHVVAIAEALGHEVARLSRSEGVDLNTGVGVDSVLAGVRAVIDVTGTATTSSRGSVAFFQSTTDTLLAAVARADIDNHVALSIVGIDRIDAGYYAGKLAQERMLAARSARVTVLRAAQFHEFAEQVADRGRVGPIALAPTALIRPVAAREVAARLVELAVERPQGRVADLVGPQDERLVDMVRRLLAADGTRRPVLEIALPGRYWRGTASGVLRGGPEAQSGTQTFAEWLRERHA